METAIIVVFVLGYLAIAFEHTLKIDKLVPALVMMAVIWAIISFFGLTVYDIDPATKSLVPNKLEKVINYFLGHTAEILIFLIGAMTIVEIIDFFNGFSTIKRLIKTKSKIKTVFKKYSDFRNSINSIDSKKYFSSLNSSISIVFFNYLKDSLALGYLLY